MGIERMMKTLGAHNRQIEKARVLALLDAGAEKAGVLCDGCARAEKETELVKDGKPYPFQTFQWLVCPECLGTSRMPLQGVEAEPE